jgi:peptidoglycan/LPS O-acetylase OafA/YrhL
MNPPDEIRPLTALRAIAALLVFLSHYSGLRYQRAAYPWQSILIEGHAGVTIFFVLSSFLITLRYLPDIQAQRFSTYDYFLKRAARILPLYWVMLALTFMIGPRTPFQLFAPVPFVNWTLTQAHFSQLSSSAIVAAWSLTIEESFYLLAPVILHFCAAFRTTRAVFFTLAVWVVGLLLLGMGLVWVAQTGGLNEPYGFMNDYGFMLYYTIFGRGFTFAWGIFLAWLYLKYQATLWTKPSSNRSATTIFILSLVGIGTAQMGMNAAGGVTYGWPFNQAVAFFAGFLILSLTCLTAPAARLLDKPLPVYLGRISYALYLLQTTPMIRTLFYLLMPIGLPATLIIYVVTSFVSALFYEGVERPARQAIVRAGSKLKLGRARA